MKRSKESIEGILLLICLYIPILAGCTTDRPSTGFSARTPSPGSGDTGFTIDPSEIRWEQTGGPEDGDFHCLEMNRRDPLEMVTGNMYGIYYSANGGSSWEQVFSGIETKDLESVPSSPETVYLAGFRNPGMQSCILKPEDGGRSWSELHSGNDIHMIRSIETAPENGEILYCAASYPARVLKSDDGGNTWKVISRFNGDFISAFAVVREGSIILGAGGELSTGEPGSIYVTTDDGNSWSTPDLGQARTSFVSSIIVHPDDPERVYLGLGDTYNRALRELPGNFAFTSGDGGSTWEHINHGLRAFSSGNLVVHPSDPGTVYAGGLPIGIPGTFRSDDRGDTWKKIDGGGIYHAFTDELYVHPTEPDRVFSIADVAALFESEDGGTIWRSVFDPQHGSYNLLPPENPLQVLPNICPGRCPG